MAHWPAHGWGRHWVQEGTLQGSARGSVACSCCPHHGLSFCFLLSAVPGRRQNTIVVKVPGQEDGHNEDGESGSEASDSVSNCGQSGSQNIGSNVTLITLNSEGAPMSFSSPLPGRQWV